MPEQGNLAIRNYHRSVLGRLDKAEPSLTQDQGQLQRTLESIYTSDALRNGADYRQIAGSGYTIVQDGRQVDLSREEAQRFQAAGQALEAQNFPRDLQPSPQQNSLYNNSLYKGYQNNLRQTDSLSNFRPGIKPADAPNNANTQQYPHVETLPEGRFFVLADGRRIKMSDSACLPCLKQKQMPNQPGNYPGYPTQIPTQTPAQIPAYPGNGSIPGNNSGRFGPIPQTIPQDARQHWRQSTGPVAADINWRKAHMNSFQSGMIGDYAHDRPLNPGYTSEFDNVRRNFQADSISPQWEKTRQVANNYLTNQNKPNSDRKISEVLASQKDKAGSLVTDDLGCAKLVSLIARDVHHIKTNAITTKQLIQELTASGKFYPLNIDPERFPFERIMPGDIIVASRGDNKPGHAAVYVGTAPDKDFPAYYLRHKTEMDDQMFKVDQGRYIRKNLGYVINNNSYTETIKLDPITKFFDASAGYKSIYVFRDKTRSIR